MSKTTEEISLQLNESILFHLYRWTNIRSCPQTIDPLSWCLWHPWNNQCRPACRRPMNPHTCVHLPRLEFPGLLYDHWQNVLRIHDHRSTWRLRSHASCLTTTHRGNCGHHSKCTYPFHLYRCIEIDRRSWRRRARRICLDHAWRHSRTCLRISPRRAKSPFHGHVICRLSILLHRRHHRSACTCQFRSLCHRANRLGKCRHQSGSSVLCRLLFHWAISLRIVSHQARLGGLYRRASRDLIAMNRCKSRHLWVYMDLY